MEQHQLKHHINASLYRIFYIAVSFIGVRLRKQSSSKQGLHQTCGTWAGLNLFCEAGRETEKDEVLHHRLTESESQNTSCFDVF